MSCKPSQKQDTFTIELPKQVILNMAGNLYNVDTCKKVSVDDLTPEMIKKAAEEIAKICMEALQEDYFDSIWDALPSEWNHCEDDGMMEVKFQGGEWAFVSIQELTDNGFKYDKVRGLWKDSNNNLPLRSNFKTVED